MGGDPIGAPPLTGGRSRAEPLASSGAWGWSAGPGGDAALAHPSTGH